jgi:anti-anti-sigma factor
MNIDVETLESNVVLVKLEGRLDLRGTLEIEDKFAFNVATKDTAVLIDMSGVDFLASIGMRMLMKNARAVQSKGGKVGLLNPQKMVKETMVTSGLEQLIPIYVDFDQASAELLAAVRKHL